MASLDVRFPGEMLATVEFCETTKEKPRSVIKAALFQALLRLSRWGSFTAEEAIKEIRTIFIETAANFIKLNCVVVQA